MASTPDGSTGRTCQPTAGKYMNIYNPEIIIAQDIYSPDHTGTRKTPEVKGQDVIPFKQWSDVTFVIWQDYCKNQPNCMQGVRGILQMSVVNPNSKTTAEQAMTKAGRSSTTG